MDNMKRNVSSPLGSCVSTGDHTTTLRKDLVKLREASVCAPLQEEELEQSRKFLFFESSEPMLVHNAIVLGDEEAVARFVCSGQDPTLEDHDGRAALHCCATMGQLACMKILLSKGSDYINPNTPDSVRREWNER